MDGIGLFPSFIHAHKPQLESSGVPDIFWEVLHKKLQQHIFDAGLAFQMAQISYEDYKKSPTDPFWKLFVISEGGISAQDSSQIYLIDHAWTYRVLEARNDLDGNSTLLNRMYKFMNPEDDTKTKEEKIEFILSEMWRYNKFFYFNVNSSSIEERMPSWYMMDEVGSSINHSDKPNFRTVPFLYLPEGVIYTLLFPVADVETGEEVTRDFVEGQTNDLNKRRALLLPWRENNFLDESFEQTEPDEDYFLSGHISESLPEKVPENIPQPKLKVYSQYVFVDRYLTDPDFEIVDTQTEADILWLTSHFKQFRELSLSKPKAFVNQFPFENVVTIKDLLSIVCRRKAERKCDAESLETFPSWLPTTFNLSTELIQFVAYYQRREEKGLDNHWICKPWNLARGLDMHVTRNLFHIMRLPATRPKIAQKYVENPVLFERADVGRVKFDVRYVVLLKSVNPLKAFAYTNFFLRFANKPFALNNFDDYEQHFTVMNYSESTPLCHTKCADFIPNWEMQYPDHPWKTRIEPKILKIFREVFEAATSVKPPKGIAESSQSRALYAVDLMLEWRNEEMQPILLEVNFAPDCQRACEYYPNFYNDVFRCLFLNESKNDSLHEL